jgi:hypothetical protein
MSKTFADEIVNQVQGWDKEIKALKRIVQEATKMKYVSEGKSFPRKDNGAYLLIFFYLENGEWKLWPEAFKDGDGQGLERTKLALIRNRIQVTATRVKVIRLPRLPEPMPVDIGVATGVSSRQDVESGV